MNRTKRPAHSPPSRQRKNLILFQKWIFERLIGILLEWEIRFVDFTDSEDKKMRELAAFSDLEFKKIYLSFDKRKGTAKTLAHELLHIMFQRRLEAEAFYFSSRSFLSKKYQARRRFSREHYAETKISRGGEDFLYRSLNRNQKSVLQLFIDDARERDTLDDVAETEEAAKTPVFED